MVCDLLSPPTSIDDVITREVGEGELYTRLFMICCQLSVLLFCVLFWLSYSLPLSCISVTSPVADSTPSCIYACLRCCVYLHYLTLFACILVLSLFLSLNIMSSIQNCFVLAIGVVVQLTHTTFRQHSVIQIPHQFAKSEIFVFLYFHQHAINFCFVMLFFFLLLYLCYFKFESQKCMNKPFSSNSVGRLVLHFAVFFTQTLRNK